MVFKNDPRAFLGGWFNKKRGQFALDVAYKVEDKETATYLAEIGEQDAIHHLDDHVDYTTEDAIRELRESGVYSESRRDELRGIQDRLHKIIQGEGADQGRQSTVRFALRHPPGLAEGEVRYSVGLPRRKLERVSHLLLITSLVTNFLVNL